jgi:hypothetical protein
MRFTLAGVLTISAAVAAHAQPTDGMAPAGISPVPWFNNPSIRGELKLTPEQFKQLNTSYDQYYKRFQTGTSGLDKLTPAHRAERINQLASTFNSDMATLVKEKLTPVQTERFNQLYYQYRGYDALNDAPVLGKLELTDKQRDQLRKFAQEYEQKLTAIYGVLDKDREAATRSYMELRRATSQRIDTLLEAQQRRAWRNLTGSPYEFQPDFSRQIKTPLTPDSP